jgi:hypothetical protein
MPNKIINLPANNPAEASKQLKKALEDPKVLLIVIGDTNLALDTVQRADRFTGAQNEPRWVVHAPVLEDVIDILKSLPDPKVLVSDWNETLLAGVSITDIIRDMIKKDGTLPSLTRLQIAWMRAEENTTREIERFSAGKKKSPESARSSTAKKKSTETARTSAGKKKPAKSAKKAAAKKKPAKSAKRSSGKKKTGKSAKSKSK